MTWTKWVVDFESLLKEEGGSGREEVKDEDYDEFAPEFDPVTGS